MEIYVRRAAPEDREEWLKMRKGIWNEAPDDYLRSDMDRILVGEREAVFLAFVDGVPAGMIEVRLREYAESCDTSPVGYIEGWFVYPDFRGRGVAGVLAGAAEEWARGMGCTEMASDTWPDNEVSIRAHQKLGYREAERLVHFVKKL